MPRRKPIIREAHLEEIARRYLRGDSQASIASDLMVSQQTVSNDLKELQRRWQQSALIDLDTKRAEELARIDGLEREYWQAWEHSKRPAQVSVQKVVSGAAGDRNEAHIRREEPSGDPRFLEGVRWCISERIKIFGLSAPVKQDLTSGGKPFERMGNDELIQFITGKLAGLGKGS